ncbi:hypothetical protein [Enterobacter sp. 22466]|uniref:hypothetical protein n=1 Tax=Enterobacter sp. 22466 TaxID=3453924 RepID=UPI003F8562A7
MTIIAPVKKNIDSPIQNAKGLQPSLPRRFMNMILRVFNSLVGIRVVAKGYTDIPVAKKYTDIADVINNSKYLNAQVERLDNAGNRALTCLFPELKEEVRSLKGIINNMGDLSRNEFDDIMVHEKAMVEAIADKCLRVIKRDEAEKRKEIVDYIFNEMKDTHNTKGKLCNKDFTEDMFSNYMKLVIFNKIIDRFFQKAFSNIKEEVCSEIDKELSCLQNARECISSLANSEIFSDNDRSRFSEIVASYKYLEEHVVNKLPGAFSFLIFPVLQPYQEEYAKEYAGGCDAINTKCALIRDVIKMTNENFSDSTLYRAYEEVQEKKILKKLSQITCE